MVRSYFSKVNNSQSQELCSKRTFSQAFNLGYSYIILFSYIINNDDVWPNPSLFLSCNLTEATNSVHLWCQPPQIFYNIIYIFLLCTERNLILLMHVSGKYSYLVNAYTESLRYIRLHQRLL